MSSTPTVLVTATQYAKAQTTFEAQTDLHFQRAPDDEDSLAEAVTTSGVRAVVVGTLRYRERLYEALERTGQGRALIARYGVGHDGVDKEQCRRRGILVTNTPGVLEGAVAELTLALLGSLARQVPLLCADMKAGRFQPRTGVELGGKRLVVVGFGAIGRHVARCASTGLGLRVTAVGRRPAAELEKSEGLPLAEILAKNGAESFTTDLDAALAAADIVSLHLPPLPGGACLLDGRRLALLKPGALLVNTARGSLVDEVALYDALAEGRLAGAALDVFAKEPYEPAASGKDLRMLPNVICTPHVGSNTAETNAKIAAACARNVRAFFAGRTEHMNLVL